MKLLIVILNYRVTDLTIDCLKSVGLEVASVPGMKVAVCENGTGGDAEQRIRDAIEANGWGSWIELTAIHPNRGFTGGNNVIIGSALAATDKPKYVMLLNADTIVHPGALSALVRFMDRQTEVGIAGSHLVWPDGSRQGSPFRFPSVASELDRGLRLGIVSQLLRRWSINYPVSERACQVDWVSGAAMIIRRQVFESIGLLDEGLFTYFDDIDFCMNAKRAGWPTWYVPESLITHVGGGSTGVAARIQKRRPPYWFQARRRFFLKNYGRTYTALADAAFLAGFALWRLRRAVQSKPDTDPPSMLADSLRNSVFLTGFALRAVENPALRHT
jgi:GT2 family glycosyltransferase